MPAGEDGIQGGESTQVVQDEGPGRGGGSEEEGTRRSAAKTLEARGTGDTRAKALSHATVGESGR